MHIGSAEKRRDMIRKNLLKSISVIMACMMAVMTVACGSNTVATEDTASAVETRQEQQLEKSIVAGAQAAGSLGEAGKVETVYVTADASGSVNDVIVSEWLKNATASSELTDTTELKDIVNVKGDENFTENGDGTVTWNADGSDIYYQGTTDKELPVDIKITYTLDGKEISPADLAGKSGKVTIRFEYENKAKQTVDVDGKNIDVYTPFAMVSGMMLDSDKFSNVEISNGKIVSDGGNYIVMGVALPGLKESLDISDDKWDELDDSKELQDKLSNSFEITADTTDFELGMTITMASSDILSDFGISDLTDSDKIDDLKDDMNELNDGSDKLVDGAGELKDGTSKLKDGTNELKDGTGKLYDGTKELKDGTGKLVTGTGKLTDGAGQLVTGAGQLADGTNTLKDGTGKLADGSNTLYNGIVAYTDGVSKVNSGAGQLAKGTSSAKEGAKKLEGGIQQTKAGADKLSAGANDFYNQLSGIPTMLNGVTGLLTKKQEVQKEYAQYSAAYAYLTGQGGSYEECAGLLSELSGGKITSAADVEELKANFLQYITVAGATQTVSQDSNDDENEVVVSGGSLENPDVQDENKDDATEGSTDQQTEETNTPAQSDEASSEESGDSQPAADPAIETADGSEEASDEGGPETAKPDNGDKEGNVPTVNTSEEPVITDEQLAAFLATEKGKNAALMCVMSDPQLLGQILSNEQVQASLLSNDELINKMLANPDVLTKITGNQELMSQLISNPAVINSILGNTELLTSLLSKDEVMALLLSNGEVMGKIMANEQVKAMVMGSDDMKYYSSTLAGYAQMVGVTAAATKTLGELLKTLDSMPIGEDSLGKVSAAVDAAKTIAYGNASLASGLDQLYEGAKTLNEGLGQLDSGASALAKGTGTLVANSGALRDGASQLKSGAGQLNDGAGQLRDGANKLSDGTKELKSGTDELNSGAKDLDTGAGKLVDGAGQLDDGAKELNDGAAKLDDGVQELLDGICKFDEEGIKKLYEAFDGDLTEFADKMTAIQEAGSNYTSFGGASAEEKSSVKFIIKTEGVKAQDI